MEYETLVSVIVITYNSSTTILDTLDSVNKQNYSNIELIISDDHSTDGTIEICNRWIKQYASRFINLKLISIDYNTGVSANCNRGIKAISPEVEWIKLIAGDDILMPDCIIDYVNFINNNSSAKVVFSNIISFDHDIKNGIKTHKPSKIQQKLGNRSVKYQLLYFNYFGQFTLSPTLFFHRSIYDIVQFDERIPMIEDVAFNYNLLRNGIKLFCMPKYTVYYRIGDSISHQTTNFFSRNFINSSQLYEKYYKKQIPNSLLGILVLLKNSLLTQRLNFFVYVMHNQRKQFSSVLFRMSNILLNRYNEFLIFIFFRFVKDKW